MIYGGLRGAIAFYLALKQEGPNKHIIITMTIIMILFTVIGLGTTTSPFLKLLDRWYPEDKILQHEDEEGENLLGLDKRRSSIVSMGVITRLEHFDENYGQKYLRKDYMANHAKSILNTIGKNDPYLDDDDFFGSMRSSNIGQSTVTRYDENIDRFFNRDAKGGDLSFRRGSRPVRLRSFRFSNQIKFAREHEQSVNLKLSSKQIEMLDSHIETFDGPAIGLPGLETIKEDPNEKELQTRVGHFIDRQREIKDSRNQQITKIKSESIEVSDSDDQSHFDQYLPIVTEKRPKNGKAKRASFRKELSTLIEEKEENEDDGDRKYNTRDRLYSEIPEAVDHFGHKI